MLAVTLFHMGIIEGKKEALRYDVLVDMGMKLFVWFDLFCLDKHGSWLPTLLIISGPDS